MAIDPPNRAVLRIRGPIERSDLEGLFVRTCALLESIGPETLLCELECVEVDAVAVDALARLALAARRHGRCVRVRGASPELRELVRFMGLEDVLAVRG
ncbi:MAG TPA: STAS domain-containing protein [Solirubrobacteraceae bacterium]|jgi:ABC-type transporter Mla MlaB component|nr:STAS domain-containing protein [Solirubrobacteraceae bacterium]